MDKQKKADKSGRYINTLVSSYFCKMRGGRCANSPVITWSGLLVTAVGSLTGIGSVALLSAYYSLPLLLPSFGVTAVLLYAACHVPMAQPRNVVGGHLVSALMGVLSYQLFGSAWWVIALGVTAAILAMIITRTLHLPGGATAFLAVYNGQNFGFILSPVGIGAICLVVIAVLVNNLSSRCRYPDYWF